MSWTKSINFLPAPETKVKWTWECFPFSYDPDVMLHWDNYQVTYEGTIVCSHRSFWGTPYLIVKTAEGLKEVRLKDVTVL